MDVTLANLNDFAKTFVAELPTSAGTRAHIVGLTGELGAGKTTFVQAVAHVMNSSVGITSPTFVFAQRYDIDHPPFTTLIHVDAYRLKPGEAHTIGWQEYTKDPKNLILVEWPEQMLGDFPSDAPILKFTVIEVGARIIEYVRK